MIILALDPDRILDESERGRAAAASLKARYDDAQAKYAKMRDAAKNAPLSAQKPLLDEMEAFENDEIQAIEHERVTLRQDILGAARPILDALRQERGADIILDVRVVLACNDEIDVTDAVIARLNEG